MQRDVTVFVVDDDSSVRESVCALVESLGVQAKGYASAEEFLESGDQHRSGCVVTDMRMLGISGLDLQERLVRDGVPIPVVVITAYAETATTVRAMRNGAITLLEKPCSDQALWDAIREALAQDAARREKHARRLEMARRLGMLTAPEREVMERIVAGKPNKVIARELDISLRTVENRRHHVFAKTGARSVPDLVRLALEAGEEA